MSQIIIERQTQSISIQDRENITLTVQSTPIELDIQEADSNTEIVTALPSPVEIHKEEESYQTIVTENLGPKGDRGEQGEAGVAGVAGPKGDRGDGGDLNYRFVQSVPSSVWTIDHNLNKKVSVTVIDSAGTQVFPELEYTSDNQVIAYFHGVAFSGEGYLN